MKLPKTRVKSLIFISTILLFLIVATANFLIPKVNWKKFFSQNNLATVFTVGVSGNWNNPATWGQHAGNISILIPIGITISPNTGKIYVTSMGSNSLTIFNPDNTPAASITNLGLNSPQSLDIDPNTEKLYIPDGANHRIVVTDASGTLITTFGEATLYNGTALGNISALKIHNGYVYISDTANNRIVVTDLDGNASTTFDGVVSSPLGIDFSPSGEIYVVTNYSQVKILNSDGTASSSPVFSAPPGFNLWGLRFSPNGQLYMAFVQSPGSSVVGLINADLSIAA
jgi:DNA-binding beta-propeller fold protein YncE